jgi:hypothetical protein
LEESSITVELSGTEADPTERAVAISKTGDITEVDPEQVPQAGCP